VIDADALHLLDDDLLEGIDLSRVLVTPHEGELAALCSTFGICPQKKLASARELADATGLTVLAKGPDNLLVSPAGRTAFFPAASTWLSTAGTGDVLAGVAASRLACSGDAFTAAGEAVWLHAEAALCAGPAFTADDLSNRISKAFAQFL
jgi:NAD(P)H-hydrate repair Nnr-like enzyme with NAD(P)H-hydrate dehydratase domain